MNERLQHISYHLIYKHVIMSQLEIEIFHENKEFQFLNLFSIQDTFITI